MKKIIVYFGIMLFVIGLVNAATDCGGVMFNKDSSSPHTVTCGLSDGICPENYGNWNGCNPNPAGTQSDGSSQYCFKCDTDCGECGSLDFVDFPSNLCPGENLDVIVTTRGLVGNKLVMIDSDTYLTLDDYIITSDGEITLNGGPVADTGGANYNLLFEVRNIDNEPQVLNDHDDTTLYKSGTMGPKITITKPSSGGTVMDEITIEAEAIYAGVNEVYYDFKIEKDSGSGVYKPVDVKDNVGDCGWCNPELLGFGLCNAIGYDMVTGTDTTIGSVLWDTSSCDNNDFKITVEATKYESGSSVGAVCGGSILVSTNNEHPGEPGKPNILNLALARINIKW